jgi:flagellar protein FliS
MSLNPPNAYLEAEVKTATPQRLRLMLIDGALRFARLTVNAIEAENNEDGCEAASRCRSICSELIGSIADPEAELHQQIIALYVFIFQRVTEGQLSKNAQLVEEAISVLELERETWQEVCLKYPDRILGEIPQPKKMVNGPPPSAILPSNMPVTGSRFSLDA